MCLLIYKPAKAPIKTILDELSQIHTTNRDGFGLAYWDPAKKKIIMKRGLVGPTQQQKEIEECHGFEAILHWRQSTGGGIRVDNCHPFRLSDGSAIAHNGIITDKRIVVTHKKSDTRILAEYSRTAEKFLENVKILDVGYSKFALMRTDGSVELVNEKDGSWDKDEIWWSNTHHRYRYVSHAYSDDYEYGSRDKDWRRSWTGSKITAPANAPAGGTMTEVQPKTRPERLTYTAACELELCIDNLVAMYGYQNVLEAVENQPYFAAE